MDKNNKIWTLFATCVNAREKIPKLWFDLQLNGIFTQKMGQIFEAQKFDTKFCINKVEYAIFSGDQMLLGSTG